MDTITKTKPKSKRTAKTALAKPEKKTAKKKKTFWDMIQQMQKKPIIKIVDEKAVFGTKNIMEI